MEKVKEYIKNNKFNISILIIWSFIAIFTMCHHEIWRDEAQVWCLVRDLNFFETFHMARVEGHPFLWYVILSPFAKLGFSVETMQVVSLLFMLFSILILLFKSPFNGFEKIIVTFNAGMLYYLPIIARNYSLIPLFLFSIAILYPRRKEHPYLYCLMIIFLSQTHVYMLGLCGILFLLFLFESIKEKKIYNFLPLGLLCVNFLFLFLCFWGTKTDNYALGHGVNNILTFKGVLLLISQIFSFKLINLIPVLQKYFTNISLSLFVPFVLAFAYKLFVMNKKVFLMFVFSIGFMLYVFCNVYFNGIIYQKSFLILLVVIFCYWIINQEKQVKSKLLSVSFFVIFLVGFLTSYVVLNEEIKFNFSGGKQVAEYIKNNLNDETTFIAYGNPYVYSSISAYLPNKKLYSIVSENYISHYSYETEKMQTKIEVPSNVKYYIVHDEIKELEEKGFTVLYKTSDKNLSSRTQQEIFSICKLKN